LILHHIPLASSSTAELQQPVSIYFFFILFASSALALLAVLQQEHPACKKLADGELAR